MTEARAACACEQLGAEVSGPPLRVAICHCHACRTRTGSAFSWNARFAAADVRMTGTDRSFARRGDEGRTITHHFCPDCGVTVWYETSGMEGIAIPLGAFAPDVGPAPHFSIYGDMRPEWLRIDPSMEVII